MSAQEGFRSEGKERALLWLLAALQLTLLLDFMVMMPLGPALMQELAITPAHFGGLVSSYTLASALAGLSGVFWLDRFERKRTLLVLYAVFMLSTLLCGSAGSATSLLVARLLAGASAGLLWALVMTLVVELVPPERRGKAIGTVMTSYALSAVAGVPLGLALASAFGWQAPFLAIAALALVLGALLSRILNVPPAQPPRAAAEEPPATLGGLFRAPLVLGWSLTFAVVFAGFLLIPYLGAFMQQNLGVAPGELSWVYFCGGAATFVSSRVVGALVDRLGAARVLVGLLLATSVPHLLFSHLRVASLGQVVLVFVLFMTLTSGRIIPTIALITERVPAQLRGRYMAVNTAVSDAASGLAAWLSGVLIATDARGALVGFDAVGRFAVCVTFTALLAVFLLTRSKLAHPDAPLAAVEA